MMNGFMYGNIFEDEDRFQRQAVFPKLLCQNAEDFSYVSPEPPARPSRPSAPARLLTQIGGVRLAEHAPVQSRGMVKTAVRSYAVPSGLSAPVRRGASKRQPASTWLV